MEKPPSLNDAEKKKAKAQKALIEKQQEAEKKKIQIFREKIQKRVHEFIKDSTKQKYRFETMDKVLRAIVHEVTDLAGLASFSFGVEEQDRYVMCWKKEFAPSDEELQAYRKGEEWDPEKAKLAAKQKELDRLQAEADSNKKTEKVIPASNYKDKYKHLIGDEAAKDAAKQTHANRSYGFVPSENKRDRRTVEQVLADARAKKKLKTEHSASTVTSSQDASVDTKSSSCPDLS